MFQNNQNKTPSFTFHNNFSVYHQEEANLPNSKQFENLFVMMMHSIIDKNVSLKQNIKYPSEPIFDFKEQKRETQNQQTISICNNAGLKQNYGYEFNHRLDPRDQLLEHKFKFNITIDYSKLTEQKMTIIEKSKTFKPLCDEIKIYLISIVENITSISFNLLNEGKLTDNQTKDFASKNILMNVNSLFKEIMKNVRLEEIVKNKEILEFIRSQKSEQTFKTEICQFIDETLKEILQNIISYYPQASSVGSSPKMKKQILNIDRNDNEELDFLMMHRLKIQRQKDGDYTSYIMKVMNKIIQVPDQFDKDDSQQTLYQKFVNFSQSLFWISKQGKYKENKQKIKQQKSNEQQIQRKKEKSLKLLNKTKLQNDKSKQNLIKQDKFQQNSRESNILQYLKKGTTSLQLQNKYFLFEEKIQNKRESQIDQMKKQHNFYVNKKLLNIIEPFSTKSIKNKQFNVTNSSMLRILTKWAQNLMHIFDHPKTYTIDRIYPFKTIKHQIFHADQEIKYKLYNQINDRKKEIQKFRDKLINNNKFFQSIFLNTDNSQQFTKIVKRYTETRILASNMNNLLIQLMKQFISKLIHLLLEAGVIKYPDQYNKMDDEIDLVVFRLGDLMRSKVYCTESSFISLLKTLYILDEQKTKGQEKQLLKLVRIKNKLNIKDNSILINYVFMGQIQCQLQMSVQRMQRKQQNYNDFNHFLYELIRGEFGVLSECATIVAQHDPILAASGSSVYKQKKKKIRKGYQIKNINIQLFICSKCQKLKQAKSQFLQQLQNLQNSQYKCDDCRIKQIQQNRQKILKDKKLQQSITKLKQQELIHQIGTKKYSELKQILIFLNQQEEYQEPEQEQLFQQNKQLQNQNQMVNKLPGENTYQVSKHNEEEKQPNLQQQRPNQLLEYPNQQQKLNNQQLKQQNQQQKSINQQQKQVNLQQKQPKQQQQKQLNLQQKYFKQFQFILNSQKSQRKQSQINQNQQQPQIEEKTKNKNHCLLISVMPGSSELNFELVGYLQCQSMLYAANLQPQLLNQMLNQNAVITNTNNKLLYFDLTQLINKQKRLPVFTYFAKNVQKIQSAMKNSKFKDVKDLRTKINIYKEKIQKSIMQEMATNRVKNKIETLAFKSRQQFQIFEQLIQNQVNSNLGSIQLVYSQNLNIKQLPLWIQKCNKLKILDVRQNKIEDISLLQKCKQITELYLDYNPIKQIQFDQFQNSWQNLKVLMLRQGVFQKIKLCSLPKLTTLKISECNKLNSIQLNEYPQLQILQISSNSLLSSIQLKSYLQLQKLQIYQNQILPNLQLKEYPQLLILNIYWNQLLASIQLKQYPQLQALNISTNQKLVSIDIPNLPETLVFILSCNSILSKIKIGSLPKLLKLNMEKQPKQQVDEIEWKLNLKGVNFVGDDHIWESIKLKSTNLKAKRLKLWNYQWNKLNYLEMQGPEYSGEENIIQFIEKYSSAVD